MSIVEVSPVEDGDACLLAHRVLSRHPQAVLQGLASGSAEIQTAFVKQLHNAIRAGALDPNTVLNAVPSLAESERVKDPSGCPSMLNADGVRPLLPTVASFVRAPQSLRLGSVCRTWYSKRALFKPLQRFDKFSAPTTEHKGQLSTAERRFNPASPTPHNIGTYAAFRSSVAGRLPRAVRRDTWALGGITHLDLKLDQATVYEVTAEPLASTLSHMNKLTDLTLRYTPEEKFETESVRTSLASTLELLVRTNSATLKGIEADMPRVVLRDIELPKLSSAHLAYMPGQTLQLANVRWPGLNTFRTHTIDLPGSRALVAGGEAETAAGDAEGPAIPECFSSCFVDVGHMDWVEVTDHASMLALLDSININKQKLKQQTSASNRWRPRGGAPTVDCLATIRVLNVEAPRMQAGAEGTAQLGFVSDVMQRCIPGNLVLRVPKDIDTQIMCANEVALAIEQSIERNACLRLDFSTQISEKKGRSETHAHRWSTFSFVFPKKSLLELMQEDALLLLRALVDQHRQLAAGSAGFTEYDFEPREVSDVLQSEVSFYFRRKLEDEGQNSETHA